MDPMLKGKMDMLLLLCAICRAKANNYPMFFFKFTATDDGRLQNLFWYDGIS